MITADDGAEFDDSVAWASSPPLFAIPLRSSDAAHRRAERVLRTVQRLHSAGHQKLRVFPQMAPSGCHWRCWIAPRDLFAANGWRLRSDVDWWDTSRVAGYTSGMGNEYFGWKDATVDSVEDLARRFVKRFPEIARASTGLDLEYTGWFSLLVGSVEAEDIPFFEADWEGPFPARVPAPPRIGEKAALELRSAR